MIHPSDPYDPMVRGIRSNLDSLQVSRADLQESLKLADRAMAAAQKAEFSHTSDDGFATVSCNGLGRVQAVIFDNALYSQATDEELCGAVLQARRRAWEAARARFGSQRRRQGGGK